jgi:hypothetical protein
LNDPEFNPFNERGRLDDSMISDKNLEELIYLQASNYIFYDPGQPKKLLQKEEIKRIKN